MRPRPCSPSANPSAGSQSEEETSSHLPTSHEGRCCQGPRHEGPQPAHGSWAAGAWSPPALASSCGACARLTRAGLVLRAAAGANSARALSTLPQLSQQTEAGRNLSDLGNAGEILR